MASESPQKIYQPIHPSLRDRLDPEYIAFHEKYLQYCQSSESVLWDPKCRSGTSPSAVGRSPAVEVGSIRDFDFGGHEQIRIFTPGGKTPEGGWPVLVWYHGGGWTMGGLNSENNFLTRCCRDAKCVVVSANYRHAPEDPYPAAINDSVDAYRWIVSDEGASQLNLNIEKVAVGGLSAGGGLAATVSLKAAFMKLKTPIFQMLLLPVIDNTATAATVWSKNIHAPWLTPARMTWYRKMYLPNEKDWGNWDASPNLAPRELLVRSPRTWIAAGELDILCQEAEDYGSLLKRLEVSTEVVVYEGSTHSLLVLDGVLAIGRRLVVDATTVLSKALHS